MIQPEPLFHFILEGLWLVRDGLFSFQYCSSKVQTIHTTLSHGPIAIAILAWQNSMVFHSLDKMTSFYIHIMPPLTCYMQVLAGALLSQLLNNQTKLC